MKKILSMALCLFMLSGIFNAFTVSAIAYFEVNIGTEFPKAGNAPGEVTDSGSEYDIVSYNWAGELDSNGHFIAGNDYTLTVEVAIKDDAKARSSFDTSPGVLKLKYNAGGGVYYYGDIISLSAYLVKGKYVLHCDSGVDFQADEYGTGVTLKKLDVLGDADNTEKNKLGTIEAGTELKILRAYVNGDKSYSKHMIEYNGGVAYVRGMDASKKKLFTKIKVEGKVDPNNLSADRVADLGEVKKTPIFGVGLAEFKAEYGTKPVVTPYENKSYKVESVEYSTDYVTEKFGLVTAVVTFVPVDDTYYFLDDADDEKAELISRSSDKLVCKYTAFTGNGDTNVAVSKEVKDYVDGINGNTVYVNQAYAKAKVKNLGGYAKTYPYPYIYGKAADVGEEVYIRDEAVNYRFPQLNGTWYMVSSQKTGAVRFMPKEFLGEIEYLTEKYMPGAPGVEKNTPFAFAGGRGTLEDPFLIETADQLNSIRQGMDMHYKLIADIDLSGWGNWTPIGATPAYAFMGGGWGKSEQGACSFQGSFDGNGHVVSGMTIKINEETPFMTESGNWRGYGLFGSFATNPDNYKIKNLGVVNYTIDVTYTDVHKNLDLYASAICGGMNNGTDIVNCYSSGGKINFNIAVNEKYRKDPTTGEYPYYTPQINITAGGICATGGGVFVGIDNPRKTKMHIEKCFNDSDITVAVEGMHNLYIGGIIGSMDTTHIHECYNSGNITLPLGIGDFKGSWHESIGAGICAYASIPEIPGIYHASPEEASFIQNCYNAGRITSRGAAGIFNLSLSDIHLENCYNVGQITGNEFENSNGFSTINQIISQASSVVNYGTEFIRNCTANGNSVSGSAWKNSSTLGRKVLSAIPEDNKPSAAYHFVAGNVGAFSDVKADAWYGNAVQWAVDKGITSGTSATTFSPDSTCTRAQILTFMWRAAGSPKSSGANPFSDVSATDYYYDAALWANSKGMISGNVFAGNTHCTRAETVVYLWKNAGCPDAPQANQFLDIANVNSELGRAVSWAFVNGITGGTAAYTFSPDTTCTRGQIVTFLNRAF